jgi:RNA polymerase sigma-70 factor (ECF subfamily)
VTPEPVPLEALVARLASSPADEEALRALYRQTWPFVFAVVYRRLHGAKALAEEASQEVFLRLVRACPFKRLRDPDAFRGYVWRVADNVARTYARRVLARHAAEVTPPEAEVGAADVQHFDRVEEELGAEELLRQVMGAIESRDRELLRLVLEGHSLSEIAKATGLTYGNAAVRLHRLRRRLRKSLFSKESRPSRGAL